MGDAPPFVCEARRWESLAAGLPPDALLRRLPRSETPPENGFYLHYRDGALELMLAGERRGVGVTRQALLKRVDPRGDLARACALRGSERPPVLDVMAGWGLDGLVLACLGHAVVATERSLAVAALNEDLAQRVAVGRSVTYRLSHGDGWQQLAALAADRLVYLDPMFPERNKRSLPNKRLQYLTQLVQRDHRPLAEWVTAARKAGALRVVVKRRLRDPVLEAPTWQVSGRTVRYDIYAPGG